MQVKESARDGGDTKALPIAKLLERATDEESASGSLPTDLVASWSRRLELTGIICLVVGKVYTILGLTLWADHSTLIGLTLWADHSTLIGLIVASCATAASGMVVLLLRVTTPARSGMYLAMPIAVALRSHVFRAGQIWQPSPKPAASN